MNITTRLNCIAALVCLCVSASSHEAAAADKPNIIVIYTDDHGYADLGCMGSMADVKTPHIDALAASGVRCTAGYTTAPQCSPSGNRRCSRPNRVPPR